MDRRQQRGSLPWKQTLQSLFANWLLWLLPLFAPGHPTDKHCKYLVYQPFRCCGAPMQLARHNVYVISFMLLALMAIKHKYELLARMLSLFSNLKVLVLLSRVEILEQWKIETWMLLHRRSEGGEKQEGGT